MLLASLTGLISNLRDPVHVWPSIMVPLMGLWDGLSDEQLHSLHPMQNNHFCILTKRANSFPAVGFWRVSCGQLLFTGFALPLRHHAWELLHWTKLHSPIYLSMLSSSDNATNVACDDVRPVTIYLCLLSSFRVCYTDVSQLTIDKQAWTSCEKVTKVDSKPKKCLKIWQKDKTALTSERTV